MRPGIDRIESAPPEGGVERLRAWFAGRAYAPHRHDDYAICLTDRGLQAFDYRGAARLSGPGQVVALHPDEPHDGRAGSDAGFGYRIVYLAPERIAEAARALCGGPVALPFAREAVGAHLAGAVAAAFADFPDPLEPLAVDALVLAAARGLLAADPSAPRRPPLRLDLGALERARRLLDAAGPRAVSSAELERASGLDRFALARQFRQAYGASPHRYHLLRRLDRARYALRDGQPLAEVAAGAGFADQAHLTRRFKAAYGLTPGRWRAASRR